MAETDAFGIGWMLYTIGLVVSGLVVTVLVAFLWRYRESVIASSLIVAFFGCALWSFVLVVQIGTGQLDAANYPLFNVLDAARYIALYAITIGILFFALAFTGREQYVRRRIAVALAILPAVTVGVIVTNHYHGLFWQEPAVPGPGNEPPVWGVFFVLHSIYAYSLILLTMVMLIGFIVRSERLYRTQALLVLLAAIIPTLGNLIYLLSDRIMVDLTPIAFSLSGALLLGAVYRYQLANVTPVARETILANMDQGVLVIDDNDRVTQANQATREMLGIDDNAPIGVSYVEFLPDHTELQQTVSNVLRTDRPDSADTSFEERYLSFTVTRMSDDRGEPIGRLLFITDVTERHERELELQQYTKLVQTVGDPMYVLDTDGYFTRVNDAFVEYANTTRDDILGSHATRFMREQDFERGTELLKQLKTNFDKRWDTYEMEFTPVDGDAIPSETMITPVRDPSGRITETVGVMRDITKRKHREEQLDLLRQVFSRVLRHNLRNDMTIIRGSASRVQEIVDDPQASEQADIIINRSQRLLSISENARDLERVIAELDETTAVDLVEVTEHVLSEISDEYDVTIETTLPDSAPVDAHKMISTAIRNILENAIVHTGDDPDISITIESNPESVVLEVRDDGPGIPDEEINVLRKGNESSLNHGSGVGLWLINFVAEESDGEVQFERDGEQTVVRMVLPAAE